jgi:hypothetical protein
MERCECEVVYGQPELVAVTVTTPDGTLTVRADAEPERQSLESLAERWSRAATPEEYLGYLDEFSAQAGAVWRPLIGPEPASATRFRFTVRPIVERAPRKKTGFSLRKNGERLFFKEEPAMKFVQTSEQ